MDRPILHKAPLGGAMLQKPPLSQHRNQWQMEDQPQPLYIEENPVKNSGDYMINVRAAFIRKVLGILSFQLSLTCLIGMILMWDSFGSNSFLARNQWMVILCGVVTVVIPIVLMFGLSKKFPINWILLVIFTVAEALSVGYMCCVVSARDDGGTGTVLQAVVTTACVVAGLTAYALTTKRCFEGNSPFGMVLLFASLSTGMMAMIFRSSALNMVYNMGTALFAGYYLIVDVQRLFRKDVDFDDYIYYSLMLYCDIILLFTDILDMMSDD